MIDKLKFSGHSMNLKNIQIEIDASFLYRLLAEHEEDQQVAAVFRQMSDIERGHALAFAKKFNLKPEQLPKPSGRAKACDLQSSRSVSRRPLFHHPGHTGRATEAASTGE